MFRAVRWYLFPVLFCLLSISALSGCRSAPPPDPFVSGTGTLLTVTATADVEIVAQGKPVLTRVLPVPGNLLLAPGETIRMQALAFDQVGREIKGAGISWQAADQRSGSISTRGVFRAGFAKGTYDDVLVVTARAPTGMTPGLVRATVSVTVEDLGRQRKPAAVRIFPLTAEVEPRETLRLFALAVDPNGVAIPNIKFKWEMLEPLAGSISQDARLTASSNIGRFPGAVRVTLLPDGQRVEEPINAVLDVRVVDPTSFNRRNTAAVLPQVISIRPGEGMRYTSLVLDRNGNQLNPRQTRWEILDERAGSIASDGRFRAGEEPGIYADAIRASMDMPGVEEPVQALGTIVIVDVSPLALEGIATPSRVAIFPEVLVLSPGESATASIIGLRQGSAAANILWSLTPPNVGEVSQFVIVTANDLPGVYEDAIHAEVTQETESGPVTVTVSATLIIRDTLNTVEITPKVAATASGQRILFRAVAYDDNGVVLPDVFFRWSVADPSVGTIDVNGAFTAKGPIGK